MSNSKGYFIAIDGCDASGKSSAIAHVKDFFVNKKGMKESDIVMTREPGGTPVGEKLRELLLTPVEEGQADLDIKTELLMMYASRNQLINEVIQPALSEGKVVITDRWESSSFAYQTNRGADPEEVMTLSQMVCSETKPDMLIFLDVEPEVSLERIARTRDNKMDRTETTDKEMYYRIRDAYQDYASRVDNVIQIDANQDLEDMLEDINQELSKNTKDIKKHVKKDNSTSLSI